ncbi:hypothetical protein BDN71DRAFT_1506883 [Pleurotus eryngii]|uniref:Uncharacterized protein n=1 Tax=Pleurotus eryngii TaxID=5323 RepID=A0A9P5ZYA1_PLEER|nr:hypothetical protein BDN71DRAFT_1506883 [Pleurotus eryngii]
MTELELVELKYKVMEGWKTWFRNASFKALMGKLSLTIKSEVILAEDLRVRIVVVAMPDTYGHKSWTLVGAEGEDYGDWDKCDAKVLFDAKNIAFNAETVID